MRRKGDTRKQAAAPLFYFYCVCEKCEEALPIVLTFCATCANICCPDLMHEFRCFECWDSTHSYWPNWSIQMLEGPLVDSVKVVLAAEIPIEAGDFD
jgi:hypothetical protein